MTEYVNKKTNVTAVLISMKDDNGLVSLKFPDESIKSYSPSTFKRWWRKSSNKESYVSTPAVKTYESKSGKRKTILKEDEEHLSGTRSQVFDKLVAVVNSTEYRSSIRRDGKITLRSTEKKPSFVELTARKNYVTARFRSVKLPDSYIVDSKGDKGLNCKTILPADIISTDKFLRFLEILANAD